MAENTQQAFSDLKLIQLEDRDLVSRLISMVSVLTLAIMKGIAAGYYTVLTLLNLFPGSSARLLAYLINISSSSF